MNESAIVMLVLSIVIIWGGLVAAVWRLPRLPQEQKAKK